MSDVFISYSRCDADFVRRLADALGDHGFSVWVDWEGIAPTAAWLAEIQRAIEGADHFVFVISPDSLASEICQLELNHAVEHHKRLVPLRWRAVAPGELPAALGARQWLEIDADQGFDAAMGRLATALRSDPDGVHEHTRLLGRAIEWRDSGGERSKLLRGRALADAERWLARTTGAPEPTPLQRDYLQASRRAARLGRRVAIGLALAVALALAVSGGLALREREAARVQGLAALSRATAAQALAEQARAYDLALLLALEAHAISPTLEAEGALQRILLARPRLSRILPTPSEPAVGLRFSVDGTRLAGGFGDGSIRLWSLSGTAAPVELPPDRPAPVSAFAFDAQLRLAALGSGQRQAISLRSLPDGALLGDLSDSGGLEVLELAFTPDDALLASANGLGSAGASLWQLASRARVAGPLLGDGGFSAVAVSPDGHALAAAGWSDSVPVWDLPSGRPLQRRALAGGAAVSGLALAGRWLAAGTSPIQLFDLERPGDGPTRELAVPAGGVRSIAMDAQAHWLAAGSEGGAVALWDLRESTPRAEDLGGQGSYVDELAFSPDGRQLATGGYGQPLRVYELDSVSRFGRLLGTQPGAIEALAFDPAGIHLAAAGRGRVIELWSADDAPPQRLAAHTADIRALAFDGARALVSADARVLPSAVGRVDVLRWDLAATPPSLRSPTPEPPRFDGLLALFPDLPALRDTPWPVALDATGQWLARPGTLHAGSLPVEVVGADDGRPRGQIATGFSRSMLALALSADGSRLAASGGDGHYGAWEVDSGRQLLQGRAEGGASCAALALTRDGLALAVGCGATLRLHRLAEPDSPPSLVAAVPASLQALAFDATGARLAAAGEDGGWWWWDVASGRTIGARFDAPGRIRTLAFSADGQQLASGDEQGRVIRWQLALDAWKAAACRIAGRSLSEAEWQRYLPGRPQRATCPAPGASPG